MIILQACFGLLTIKDLSKMCSFITQCHRCCMCWSFSGSVQLSSWLQEFLPTSQTITTAKCGSNIHLPSLFNDSLISSSAFSLRNSRFLCLFWLPTCLVAVLPCVSCCQLLLYLTLMGYIHNMFKLCAPKLHCNRIEGKFQLVTDCNCVLLYWEIEINV